MALDFPSNPSDGEVYGSYIYNLAKGVWQGTEESAAVAVTSPTRPTTASPGDIWVNTATGIAFVYYNDGNTSQWMELLSSAVPTVNEIMPYGTIVQTARSTAPTGWLLCQGQTVSRTTYSGLFSAIGTTYGSGDGSTTFAIPNLQNRIPVGLGSEAEFDTLGETGGAKTHILTTTEMPSHTHVQNSHNHTQDSHSHSIYDPSHAHPPAAGHSSIAQNTYPGNTSWYFPGGGGYLDANAGNTGYATTGISIYGNTATNQAAIATNQNTGGGGAHNNLQPYIVLNYMIKV